MPEPSRPRNSVIPHGRMGSALLLALTAMLAAPAAAQVTTGDLVDQIDQDNFEHYLTDLMYTHPGDDRGFGPEHDLARQNIVDTLESFGLRVGLHPFDWEGDTYYNVVATKPGTVCPDQQYIIGAHYDSVGNPGADDNAAGVSGLMEIARVVSQYDFECTIVFIAFDREEQGLVGSNAYVQDHLDDDIRGVVAMDMISHNVGRDGVIIRGRATSSEVKVALIQSVLDYGEGLTAEDVGQADVSNHAPFEWAGFRAAQMREYPGNPYWHTMDDHIENPDAVHVHYGWKVIRSVCGWLVSTAVLTSDCAPDIDGDGMVGFTDLVSVLATWGPCPGCAQDIDGDGTVGFTDLVTVLAAWGPCP